MVQSAISVIIPTFRRPEKLRKTLETILRCEPRPGEILVHVDAGDYETLPYVRQRFAGGVEWLSSDVLQGPGGARNRLVRAARFPLVASFDDDSSPMDKDYFKKAEAIFAQHKSLGAVTAHVLAPGEAKISHSNEELEVASFESGASVLCRDAFLRTSGFVAVATAYGMEEVDVSLQLLDAGWSILKSSALRVYHDSQLVHHASAQINAAHVTNTALLAFLRYPSRYLPLGAAQVLNRVRYAVRKGRWRGIIAGLVRIPSAIWHHRHLRRPVRPTTIVRSRKLSRACR